MIFFFPSIYLDGCVHQLNKLISVNKAYCQFIFKFKPLLSIPYILEKTVGGHSPNASSLINGLLQRLFEGHAKVSQ